MKLLALLCPRVEALLEAPWAAELTDSGVIKHDFISERIKTFGVMLILVLI